VIDEIDEMLNLGFRAQLISLMGLLPEKRQNLLFSATLTKDVEALFIDYFKNPHKIEVAAHGTPIEKIAQFAYLTPNFHTKINLLEWLLNNDAELKKVLVFVNSKKMADQLYEFMDKPFNGNIGVIHSNKSQNFRLNALKQFQEGTFRVLIATDIIARGLDITDVTHVVNFETPEVPGDYIHRIGRTGRAEKDGIAITFANEQGPDQLKEIEQLMKKPVPRLPLPENLTISTILLEEEQPKKLHDKDYLKATKRKDFQGAFHEKKDKNLKVNLGGPKKRNPKYGKPAKPKMTKKSGKTRF
jgi:ATP-dependent RNA helicase RhlE